MKFSCLKSQKTSLFAHNIYNMMCKYCMFRNMLFIRVSCVSYILCAINKYLAAAGFVREFTSYIHIILVQYNVVQIVTQKTTIKW